MAWWAGNGDGRDVVGAHDVQLRGSLGFSAGLVDDAYTFRNAGDFGEVAQAPELDVGTRDFTVQLWVRFTDTLGEQVLIEDFSDATPTRQMTGWTLTKLVENTLRLHVASDAVRDLAIDTPPLVTAGRWLHVAARRSGPVFAILVNGIVAVQSPGVGDALVNLDSATSILLGRRGDAREFFFRGEFDEIQLVIGRAMSDTELAAIYRAGSRGTCST